MKKGSPQSKYALRVLESFGAPNSLNTQFGGELKVEASPIWNETGPLGVPK